MAEIKFYDSTVLAQVPKGAANQAHFVISRIPEGTGINQRMGRRALIHDLYLSYIFSTNWITSATIRFIVFTSDREYRTSDNIVSTVQGTLPPEQEPFNLLLPINPKLLRTTDVLYDEIIELAPRFTTVPTSFNIVGTLPFPTTITANTTTTGKLFSIPAIEIQVPTHSTTGTQAFPQSNSNYSGTVEVDTATEGDGSDAYLVATEGVLRYSDLTGPLLSVKEDAKTTTLNTTTQSHNEFATGNIQTSLTPMQFNTAISVPDPVSVNVTATAVDVTQFAQPAFDIKRIVIPINRSFIYRDDTDGLKSIPEINVIAFLQDGAAEEPAQLPVLRFYSRLTFSDNVI